MVNRVSQTELSALFTKNLFMAGLYIGPIMSATIIVRDVSSGEKGDKWGR
jgi:hypothetical protein